VTVTITKGLSARIQREGAQKKATESKSAGSKPQNPDQVSRSSSHSSATSTSLRSTRSSERGEKIKDYDEAKDLAQSLAEKISEGEEGAAHTELSTAVARDHFTH